MADERDLIPRAEREHATFAGMWFATVTLPLPTSEVDPLYVILPDIDLDTAWKCVRWMPRFIVSAVNVAEGAQAAHVGGVAEAAHNVLLAQRSLPVVGSEALLIFDNRQNPWVVAWL